ncbi:MAG: NAD(P)-binding protein, partial [Pseudomonadota bacterium]
MSERPQIAVIAGGGPAGLTAALELLRRTDVVPLVFEAADGVGGISRTHVHNGNRIDIGGHRFFSKSKRVMDWWREILPLQGLNGADESLVIAYQNKQTIVDLPADGPDPREVDQVMLVRPRTSRILFKGELFDYPLSLSPATLLKLGLWET